MGLDRVRLVDYTGTFAGDKDQARELRERYVVPALRDGREVELDFDRIEVATQSFIHALISAPLRRSGEDGLDYLVFVQCGEAVQAVIETVVDYTLSGSLESGDGTTHETG